MQVTHNPERTEMLLAAAVVAIILLAIGGLVLTLTPPDPPAHFELPNPRVRTTRC